jgi:hypothetical protein
VRARAAEAAERWAVTRKPCYHKPYGLKHDSLPAAFSKRIQTTSGCRETVAFIASHCQLLGDRVAMTWSNCALNLDCDEACERVKKRLNGGQQRANLAVRTGRGR